MPTLKARKPLVPTPARRGVRRVARIAPLLPCALLLLAPACTAPACTAPAPPRPNILLVTMDTTRVDAIGAYGNTSGATPSVDRIAAEGIRFDRAYTVTPLTIPAHSSIHTGMLPPRHGVRDNGDFFLGDDAVTLAERLHAAGYATMASVGAEVTSHHWGFAQGFDRFFDDMGPADPHGNRWRVERSGDKVAADALGWLDTNAKSDKPWFAWVHLFDAHHPYEPPPAEAARFPGRPYIAEVAFADAQVGALRARLDALGVLDHTWIFVVADHGEGMGSHGEAMHGVLLYDATTHIPFVVRPPAGAVASGRAGAAVSTPVSLVDLTPTILGVAGLPQPTGLDGVDLGPTLRGDVPGDANRAVFAESLYAFHHYGWAPQSALVTNDNKLLDSTTPELYARTDTNEADDLAGKDPALLGSLEGRLDSLVAAITPANAASRADASPDRIAQLEALGYLTTTAGSTAGGAAGGTAGAGLPDPVHQLPVLAKLEAARRAFAGDDIAAARTAIDAALAADPGLAETRMLQVTLLWRTGDLAGAFAAAVALDAASPSSQTKVMMGSLRLQMGDPVEAARLLNEALSIDPYLATAWSPYLRALLLSEDPRFPAEAARAASLVPDVPEILGLQGVALAMQGNPAPAERLLTAALSADPNQPFLNHALGIVSRARADTTHAEAYFEEEIRLYPPALPSRRALVEIYADQKRYDDQLAQLAVIRAQEAPTAETQHSIAQALFNLKRYDEAKAEVDTCRALAPAYPGCALLEANVLKKLGRDAEAQAAYERAVALTRSQATP